MRVGILGSGLMGGKLGTIFARAGREVIFSYARGKDKLEKQINHIREFSVKVLKLHFTKDSIDNFSLTMEMFSVKFPSLPAENLATTLAK